ncbi:hypothetical protein J2S96_002648, partial [Arthrobacter bambusae]|nr:hypothetical protein [Arthrobacter bambusae]
MWGVCGVKWFRPRHVGARGLNGEWLSGGVLLSHTLPGA